MVDVYLPKEDRRLRSIILDLNSFFASVEQQENPRLRGKPVGVAPVDAESTSIIAASYEAKRHGVKCGVKVADARRMCPGIEIVKASMGVHAQYHRAIKLLLGNVIPIEEELSIDEFSFRLVGTERTPEVAREIALRLKEVLRERVGEYVTCSIGIAPNRFLAKIASDMQKPNGLVVIQAEDLPHKLHRLRLTDLPGINVRMQRRLQAALILTVEGLCAASRTELLRAFGSIVGERWWYLLQGYDLGLEVQSRRSLGHSHVLPPEMRHDQGVKEVLLRLLQKASARLRAFDLFTERMSVSVSSPVRGWWTEVPLPPTQDTIVLNERFLEVWEARDFQQPRKVSVNFTHLKEPEGVTPSLFDETLSRTILNRAVDRVNGQFGKNSVYLAGMDRSKAMAEEKIAFRKTELFSEGKGDNDDFSIYRRIVGTDDDPPEWSVYGFEPDLADDYGWTDEVWGALEPV